MPTPTLAPTATPEPAYEGLISYKSRGLHVIQHIFNGGNAHFDTGITFPQQFDGILFNHETTLLLRFCFQYARFCGKLL